MQAEPLPINPFHIRLMKTFKKYSWLIVLAIICIFAYAYHEYTRKPADLNDVRPEASVQAAALVQLYENDEQQANKRYLGKAIDVTGIVSEINNQQDTSMTIMLGKKGDLHRVSCLLSTNQAEQIHTIKTGSMISLRGICTGYLLDVELNRCVIIKP